MKKKPKSKKSYIHVERRGFERLLQSAKQTNVYGRTVLVLLLINFLAMILGVILNLVWNFSFKTELNPLMKHLSWSSLASSFITFVLTLSTSILGVEAVLRENEFQLVVFFVTNLVLSITVSAFFVQRFFGIIQSALADEPGNEGSVTVVTIIFQSVTVLSPSVPVIISQFILLFVCIPLFRSFGWRVFKKVGSNINLRRYYRTYLIYVAMLKADAIVNLTAVIWTVWFFKITWIPTYIGVMLSLTFTFILSPISVKLGVKREMYSIQISVFLWGLVTPCFLVYHTIHTWISYDACNLSSKTLGSLFILDEAYVSLIFIALAASVIFVRIIVLAICSITMKNFGRGLKDVFAGRDMSSSFDKHAEMSRIQALLNDNFYETDEDDD